MVERNYNGCKKDEIDVRDYTYTSFFTGDLPITVDLRKYFPPVEDQGSLGSCTACAAVGLIEFLEKKADVQFYNFSKLFVYYNTRLAIGTVDYDSGASIRGVLRSVAKQGACHESMWRYYIWRYRTKPNEECYTEGLNHQILYYLRLYSLSGVKQCLADGYPVICGIDLYESFEGITARFTGKVPLPKEGEEYLGKHAIDIVGYDSKYFICRNSWGPFWGDHGYFYLLPEYLTKYGADFWTIKGFEGV